MVFAFSPCFDCGDDKMTIFNCKGETLADGKAKCDVMLQKANRQKLVFDGNLTDCDRVKNPATDIAWIAELIKSEKALIQAGGNGSSVIQSYLYRGKRIYFVLSCGSGYNCTPFPFSGSGSIVYADVATCSTEYLGGFGGVQYDPRYTEILKEISHPILIYKP
jgi:hypothetical protein